MDEAKEAVEHFRRLFAEYANCSSVYGVVCTDFVETLATHPGVNFGKDVDLYSIKIPRGYRPKEEVEVNRLFQDLPKDKIRAACVKIHFDRNVGMTAFQDILFQIALQD